MNNIKLNAEPTATAGRRTAFGNRTIQTKTVWFSHANPKPCNRLQKERFG